VGGGGQHGAELLAVVGGGEREQSLGVLGQRAHLSEERVLDLGAERHVVEQRRAPGSLLLGQAAGQLQQGKRVAVRDLDELVAEGAGESVVEQRRRRGFGEAGEHELGQAGGHEATALDLARRREHGDRVGLQAAGGEEERVGRGPVEPVRVVDHAGQRLLVPDGGQQREHGDGDDEAIGHAVCREAEGRVERFPLDLGQAVRAVEHRPQELVQAGERQL
jgi:hypothetical protein